jgi:SAM-dependent methyltransferase
MKEPQLPQIIDGIKCYAPELAYVNDNFSPETFERLFNAEDRNFWFRSRNRIVRHFMKKIIAEKKFVTFLEVGCGTGYVLKGLKGLDNILLNGSELYLEGLKFAKKRLPEIELIQLNALNMPFVNSFDAIGAFDVLEHIDDDVSVMKQANAALKQGGYFLISVPQHPFIWSYLDDMAFHRRRYTRKELKEKLKVSGFEVKYITSFVFVLFPMMLISRWLKRKKTKQYVVNEQMKELELPRVLNFIFESLLRIDEFFIKLGISLPFGGSLIAIVKK